MNDINKMRAEFEQKLKYAEKENELETKLGCDGFRIVGESLTHKGKLHAYFLNEMNKAQAAQILKALPATENYKTDLTYQLETHRYPNQAPNQAYTLLSIAWMHNEFDITLKMKIDEQDETLMQYFQWDSYQLSDSEIGLFYGAVSPRVKKNLRDLRFLTFNCGTVHRYYGGYRRQVSNEHACCILLDIIGE